MKVISIAHRNGAEEVIITATGREVTALEDAIYHRAVDFGNNPGKGNPDHMAMLGRMLDDVRRPYEATR
jgi:hypothetical protein